MEIVTVTPEVQNLFTANLEIINAKLKTNWTSFQVVNAWKQLVSNGVNYRGQGLGNGKLEFPATVILYRPDDSGIPQVKSAHHGWYD